MQNVLEKATKKNKEAITDLKKSLLKETEALMAEVE